MIDLRVGDCIDVLATLEAGSVRTCVTSPPYFGLRDYGTAEWEGGDAACDHGAQRIARRQAGRQTDLDGGVPGSLWDKPRTDCSCGARRVDRQIGLEATPDAYIARMVDVFRAVRRVLSDDGTLWLNMGDSYGSPVQGRNDGGREIRPNKPATLKCGEGRASTNYGCRRLGPKQLLGMPWRVALALQADGWILRSDIVWAKPNPMPESVRDRPTKSHEYIFLLAKQGRYYYDAEGIREPHSEASIARSKYGLQDIRSGSAIREAGEYGPKGDGAVKREYPPLHPGGRNARTVWQITPRPFKGAHFATFPPELAERCIKAGSSERGQCPDCGKPWVRVVERESMVLAPSGRAEAMGEFGRTCTSGTMISPPRSTTIGWRPTCEHYPRTAEWPGYPGADYGDDADDAAIEAAAKLRRELLDIWADLSSVPDVVLDPFAGAGTTPLVAEQLGRHGIGIELSPDYEAMAQARIDADRADYPLFAGDWT